MIAVDYLIVALVVISAIVGLARGLLREAIALLSWIIAPVLAWHFSGTLEPHLGGTLAEPHVAPWAARGILLFAVLLVGAGIGALVVSFVRLSLSGAMDHFLGLVCGLLRGLVTLGVLVLFCQMLRLDGEHWWRRSLLIPYGVHAAGAVGLLVGRGLEHREPALVAALDPGAAR